MIKPTKKVPPLSYWLPHENQHKIGKAIKYNMAI